MVIRKWFIRLLPALFLLIGLSLQPPQNVSANAANSYYWSMTFDFEGDYTGLLYVEYIDANSISHQSTTEILCVPVGSVRLDEHTADFSGGFLDCEVPSIQDILAEMTGIAIGEQQTYCPFVMETKIIFSKNQSLQPILAHMGANGQPDAVLQVQSGESSWLQAQFANTHLSQGDPFYNAGDVHFLQTEIKENCFFHHTVDETLTIDPTPIGGADFYIDDAQLLIGYDVDTGTTLNGRIDYLLVDPGDFIKIH